MYNCLIVCIDCMFLALFHFVIRIPSSSLMRCFSLLRTYVYPCLTRSKYPTIIEILYSILLLLTLSHISSSLSRTFKPYNFNLTESPLYSCLENTSYSKRLITLLLVRLFFYPSFHRYNHCHAALVRVVLSQEEIQVRYHPV